MTTMTMPDLSHVIALAQRGWTFTAMSNAGIVTFSGDPHDGRDGCYIGRGDTLAEAVASFVDGLRCDYPEALDDRSVRPRPIIDHPAYALLRER